MPLWGSARLEIAEGEAVAATMVVGPLVCASIVSQRNCGSKKHVLTLWSSKTKDIHNSSSPEHRVLEKIVIS